MTRNLISHIISIILWSVTFAINLLSLLSLLAFERWIMCVPVLLLSILSACLLNHFYSRAIRTAINIDNALYLGMCTTMKAAKESSGNETTKTDTSYE